MYILDPYDLLFIIKALKQPQDHFNIQHHVFLALIIPDQLPLTN